MTGYDMARNIPLVCIILTLFSGPLSLIISARAARRWNLFVISFVGIMNMLLLAYVYSNGMFVYKMGHFPAPWGNEIRVGVLEAFMVIFFCIIMFLSMIGGALERNAEIEESKENLYYVMVNLLLTSLISLVYTNDLFTAYVFVEINTISACGLIMIRQTGRTLEAATRYMIMSLLGSGLLLLGICFLYGLTGHLLMSNIKDQVELIVESGEHATALIVAVGLMSVGLAIKSALFPFHAWIPDAYGYSNVSSQAILSSLVSKGYIFLLIKIYYRVIGMEEIYRSHIVNVLFVFGICGMIFGSISAINQSNIRRTIAYSSVAQIGYIYMGFGLGTTAGMLASVYHIFSHALAKSLLFVSASGIKEASDHKSDFFDLTGAAYRNKICGLGFTIGALSMVGFPGVSGFISKLLFAQAALDHEYKVIPTLVALALSTILNTVYFLKTVIRLYTPMDAYEENERNYRKFSFRERPAKSMACICLMVLITVFGLFSQPIIKLCEMGLEMFS